MAGRSVSNGLGVAALAVTVCSPFISESTSIKLILGSTCLVSKAMMKQIERVLIPVPVLTLLLVSSTFRWTVWHKVVAPLSKGSRVLCVALLRMFTCTPCLAGKFAMPWPQGDRVLRSSIARPPVPGPTVLSITHVLFTKIEVVLFKRFADIAYGLWALLKGLFRCFAEWLLSRRNVWFGSLPQFSYPCPCSSVLTLFVFWSFSYGRCTLLGCAGVQMFLVSSRVEQYLPCVYS